MHIRFKSKADKVKDSVALARRKGWFVPHKYFAWLPIKLKSNHYVFLGYVLRTALNESSATTYDSDTGAYVYGVKFKYESIEGWDAECFTEAM